MKYDCNKCMRYQRCDINPEICRRCCGHEQCEKCNKCAGTYPGTYVGQLIWCQDCKTKIRKQLGQLEAKVQPK